MSRLVHVSADDPGYHRKGRGTGFEYFDEAGRKISESEILERIDALRIPPAWKNVWVCTHPEGHLQATGIDARERKQYLYHPEWTLRSNTTKFERMPEFARALPELRRRIQNDLRKEGWPREKVIALIITILDQFSLRIGNKAYEQENGTFGVTTLKNRHLKSDANGLHIRYKAKGGKLKNIRIRSKKLARLIRECSEIPGQEVFQYVDTEGNAQPVFSQDVNGYLQDVCGSYTAKDFRTWGGTVWSIALLPEAMAEVEASPRRSLLAILVKHVAEKLGNTMAVCKAFYIHPAVLAMVEKPMESLEELQTKAEEAYVELKDVLSKDELLALYVIEGGSGRNNRNSSSSKKNAEVAES